MDEVALALNIAASLPGLISAYQKLVNNNQNAGLVPVETLLADAIAVSQAGIDKADAEIAKA